MNKSLIWLKRDLRTIDQPLLEDWRIHPGHSDFIYFRFVDEEINASVAQREFRNACLTNFFSRLALVDASLAHESLANASLAETCIDSTHASFVKDFSEVLTKKKPDKVITSTEFDAKAVDRNRAVQGICEKLGIEFQEINTFTLFSEPDLNTLPIIFTDYRKKAEAVAIDFGDLSFLNLSEDSSPACMRLNHYLFGSKRIQTYKETRNGLLDPDDSSKFSPYFAQGALSVKRVWFEVNRFESQFGQNESTYWLKFELLWREFFIWNAKNYAHRLYELGGIRQKQLNVKDDSELVEAWKMGKTADPFVNANMNELRLTGWMSNRGRQNVASYFIHDLGLDWRLGAQWFQTQLIDHEPCANLGNWAYLAGVGNDPRPFRKFNVEWQRNQYDPTGEYVRRWTN